MTIQLFVILMTGLPWRLSFFLAAWFGYVWLDMVVSVYFPAWNPQFENAGVDRGAMNFWVGGILFVRGNHVGMGRDVTTTFLGLGWEGCGILCGVRVCVIPERSAFYERCVPVCCRATFSCCFSEGVVQE